MDGYNGAQALAGLKEASVLHTLHVSLWCSKVGGKGAMHTLHLDLAYTCVPQKHFRKIVTVVHRHWQGCRKHLRCIPCN